MEETGNAKKTHVQFKHSSYEQHLPTTYSSRDSAPWSQGTEVRGKVRREALTKMLFRRDTLCGPCYRSSAPMADCGGPFANLGARVHSSVEYYHWYI